MVLIVIIGEDFVRRDGGKVAVRVIGVAVAGDRGQLLLILHGKTLGGAVPSFFEDEWNFASERISIQPRVPSSGLGRVKQRRGGVSIGKTGRLGFEGGTFWQKSARTKLIG